MDGGTIVRISEWFCQAVCGVIGSVYILVRDMFLFANEMMTNINVLCTVVRDGIALTKGYSTLVVTEYCISWRLNHVERFTE